MLWFLFIILLFISFSPLFVEAIYKKFDVFEFKNLFIVSYFIFYGVRTIDLYFGSPSFLSFDTEKEFYNQLYQVLVYANLGILFLQIGYYLPFGNLFAAMLPGLKGEWSPGRVRVIVRFFLFLGILAIILVIYKGGGFYYYLTNINLIRLSILNDVAYIKFLIDLIAIAFLIQLIQSVKSRNKSKRKIYFIGGIAFLSSMVFGHRYVAMHIIGYAVLVYHYSIQKVSLKKLMVIGLLLLIFNVIFATYREFTNKQIYADIGFSDFFEKFTEGNGVIFLVLLMLRFGFHGTDSLIIIKRLVEDGSMRFHYGWYWLQDFISSPVPYSVWPDKPRLIATKFNNLVGGVDEDFFNPDAQAGGVVQTILGDLYWAFGFLGIPLGMFFLGILFSVVYKYFVKDMYNSSKIAIYSIIYFYFFGLTSSIATQFVKIFYFLIPALLSIQYIREREHINYE